MQVSEGSVNWRKVPITLIDPAWAQQPLFLRCQHALKLLITVGSLARRGNTSANGASESRVGAPGSAGL